MTRAYDDIGALSGTFAPAYIHGDPISEAAVARWNAAHLRGRPQGDRSGIYGAVANSPGALGSSPLSSRDAIAMAMLGLGGESGGNSGELGGFADPGSPSLGTPADVGTPDSTPSSSTPSDRGEPTAEEDAAALAAANAEAISGGFMNPDGTPGANTTTTSQSLGPTQAMEQASPADEAQAANPSSANPSIGFAGFSASPSGVVGVAPGVAVGPNGAPQGGLSAEGLANSQAAQQGAVAAAAAQAAPSAPSAPSAPAAPGATGLSGVAGLSTAPGVASNIGVNAALGLDGPLGFDTSPTAQAQAMNAQDAQMAEGLANATAQSIGQLGTSPGYGMSLGSVAGALGDTGFGNPGFGDPGNVGAGDVGSVAGFGPGADASGAAADAAGLGMGVGDVGGFGFGVSGTPGETGTATVGDVGAGVDGFGVGATGIAGLGDTSGFGFGDPGTAEGVGLGGLGGEGDE